MDKVIKIDLLDKYDLVEKYNEDNVSKELIEYIIEQAMHEPKKDNIKIIINKKCPIDKDCTPMIIQGLKREYDKGVRRHNNIDIKQYIFFVWGIVALFLSSLVKEEGVWK